MWTGLYYYHLEIDNIATVTRRVYKVSVNLLSKILLSRNLQAPTIQQHYNYICIGIEVVRVA